MVSSQFYLRQRGIGIDAVISNFPLKYTAKHIYDLNGYCEIFWC